LQISALKVISERENEEKQKSYTELSKTELSIHNQEPPSLKMLKKPNETKDKDKKAPDNSPELKNDEDDMLDKALDQIEKENLPLTYEVKQQYIFKCFIKDILQYIILMKCKIYGGGGGEFVLYKYFCKRMQLQLSKEKTNS